MPANPVLRVERARDMDFTGLGVILRVPAREERSPDLETEFIRFFGRLGVMDSDTGIELGICTYRRRPFIVDRLERHRLSAELLVAVDDDFIMPVAANREKQDLPDLSRIAAVRVGRGEGILFARGVWHGVPYPLKRESFALVGFKLDTAKNDIAFHDLDPKLPIQV